MRDEKETRQLRKTLLQTKEKSGVGRGGEQRDEEAGDKIMGRPLAWQALGSIPSALSISSSSSLYMFSSCCYC